MARKPRLFAPGVLYHVVVRGNQRQRTFLSAADYQTYLQKLAQYRRQYDVTIYAYCLMPNHVLCSAQHNQCYVKLRVM